MKDPADIIAHPRADLFFAKAVLVLVGGRGRSRRIAEYDSLPNPPIDVLTAAVMPLPAPLPSVSCVPATQKSAPERDGADQEYERTERAKDQSD